MKVTLGKIPVQSGLGKSFKTLHLNIVLAAEMAHFQAMEMACLIVLAFLTEYSKLVEIREQKEPAPAVMRTLL